MDLNQDTDFIDDEVFFGKLTLKEVKRHILMDLYEKKLSNRAAGDGQNYNAYDTKIIQTSSQPNILSRGDIEGPDVEHLKSTSYPLVNRPCDKANVAIPDLKTEDSFLEIEKNINEQSDTPNKNNKLDNTLDVVDLILNHVPSYTEGNKKCITNEVTSVACDNHFACDVIAPKDEILSQSPNVKKQHKDQVKTLISNLPSTKVIKDEEIYDDSSLAKNVKVESNAAIVFNTPVSNKGKNLTVFKTPKLPLSSRKDTCLKRTPSRSRAYEHITSPIASYIKNTPQVPLVKDVYPKKPLPSTSSIPKPMKNNLENKKSNKENVVLPSLAYKNAKKTTVINMGAEKCSQSTWSKKLKPSLQKPVVLKHDYRESKIKPLVTQQDSFANLTLHQADVSVCTQKHAFSKPQ